MTRTRPPTLDEHGVEHRSGCTLPGWYSDNPAVIGWHIVTCPGCGAVRLIPAHNHATNN